MYTNSINKIYNILYISFKIKNKIKAMLLTKFVWII